MRAWPWLLLAVLALPGVARAQVDDLGDSTADIAQAEELDRQTNPEAYRQMKQAESEAQERMERWQKQRQNGQKEEIYDKATLEKLFGRIPEGPAYLGDLQSQAQEEQRQLAKQGIEKAVQELSVGQDIQALFRSYLFAVFGDMSTPTSAFITEALSTPGGWRKLSKIKYENLPDNIAGLSGNPIKIDPNKGNSIMVVNHEETHNIQGTNDVKSPGQPGWENSAYNWMRRGMGGKGKGANTPNDDAKAESFSPQQCSM